MFTTMAIRIDANTIFEDGRVKKVGETKAPKVEDKKSEDADGGKGTKEGRGAKGGKAAPVKKAEQTPEGEVGSDGGKEE
jgi:hypothetical protein|nr:MAG TPA: hypothetical protein [Caudoviricetes sp.]